VRLRTRILLAAALAFALALPAALGLHHLGLSPALEAVLLAGGAALGAFLVATYATREVSGSLRRLAQATSQMARTGTLRGDFLSPDAIPEVREFEQALQRLVESVEIFQRDRERSYVEAIGAVVAAVDARDQETSGHSFRVAQYAVALARQMGITDIEGRRAIEWGALLHDVGKIAVPDAILRKVGPLTEEEWHIMRQHASWGYEILADVQFLRPALAIVYSHHERWDGAGYPRGLSGERIPLTARIFAVVDTYDAITSERPYRRARGHREAVAELQRVAGSQLDPEVVEAFLSIPEVELRRLRSRSSSFDLDAFTGVASSLPGSDDLLTGFTSA